MIHQITPSHPKINKIYFHDGEDFRSADIIIDDIQIDI